MHWGGEGEGLPFATSLGGGAVREHCFGAGVSGVPARTGRSVLMFNFYYAIVILIGIVIPPPLHVSIFLFSLHLQRLSFLLFPPFGISPFTWFYLYFYTSLCKL